MTGLDSRLSALRPRPIGSRVDPDQTDHVQDQDFLGSRLRLRFQKRPGPKSRELQACTAVHINYTGVYS